MGMHPFDPFAYHNPHYGMPARHVRAPPRRTLATRSPAQAHAPAPEPAVRFSDKSPEHYLITVSAPDGEHELHDVRATNDDGTLVLEGVVVTESDGLHSYVTNKRAGVYAQPQASRATLV